MKIRIVHNDGKDEVYSNVLKLLTCNGCLFIYTNGRQYIELLDDIIFTQTWFD